MAVFRVEKNKGYTVMSNHHLRNKELSLKAKGLLSQMLSLPEDWDYTLAGLSLINRESIDAIRTAVWELEKALAHVHYDKANQPGVSNLMSIHSAISGKTFEEIETMYDGQGYGTFKKDVADLVVEELSPIRSRYDELTGTPELDAILDDGAVRARVKARMTYENAIHAMGLYRK